MAAEVDKRPPEVSDSTDLLSSNNKRKSALPELEVDLSLPEPPSKKVKRALKKGKPLPDRKHSSDEASDLDIPSKEDNKSKKERSEYGVWIGNLPFILTRVELFKWLIDSSGGSITEESITRVNLPTSKDSGLRGRDRFEQRTEHAPEKGPEQKPAPFNKGFAYVDFATFDASVAAIALSEADLSGRKLLIKNSKSFEGRPAKREPKAVDPNAPATEKTEAEKTAAAASSRKIFVGNLSFQTTEDDLWAHFEKCGAIQWVKVATFEDTGKCKGYGWVKFAEPEAAEWAVKGFVKIKEEVETEEDFMDDAEDGKGDEKPKTPRKTKTRKWWVNMLKGRTLKIQMAEDDQLRYKKRFGKDATKGSKGRAAPGALGETEGELLGKPASSQDDIVVARLTGRAVEPQGKKTALE